MMAGAVVHFEAIVALRRSAVNVVAVVSLHAMWSLLLLKSDLLETRCLPYWHLSKLVAVSW